MKLLITLLLFLFQANSSFTQKEYKRILLESGTVHVGNGQVYGRGLIGVVEGKITLVRNSLAYTYKREDWDTIINLDGQHVYPGFVAPNSTLGLTEIDAIRASTDFDEVGKWNPNVRSIVAFNCESEVLATVKANGILIVQTTPRGGLISGKSSLVAAQCWNWEDGLIKEDDGVHINWPQVIQYGGSETFKMSSDYLKQVDELSSYFTSTKSYNPENGLDLRYASLKKCFTGEARLFVHANDQQQLLDVIDFVKTHELKNVVVVGGRESYLVAERLKEQNISVMLPRVTSLPDYEDEAVDLPFRLPKLLQDAGVKFCLQNEGDMEAMNVRNLPFLAGLAMSYGLTEEEAIRSISLSSCEILGIDKLYGSIEEGKLATLFVSKGSALDMRTHQTTLILVNGKFAPITNRQDDLYRKYKTKYGLD